MLSTLNDEGYEIKERELMRVRAKNRWLLRIPNGAKPSLADESFQAQLLETMNEEPIPEDIARKRKERHDQLQEESDQRWASKKRRRRTREYAGIAADPPGPPRFPSETTLAESMEFLNLDKKQYKAVRDHFQKICEEEEIVKKTLAGPDKWQAAKDRLVQEDPTLQAVFVGANSQAKELALDVICTDVTKRMRTTERRMTIVDSKNALGLNPEQSRQIRNGFYQILQANHFTSKLETGHEHWQKLKDQWVETTPLLRDILASSQSDQDRDVKQKALEVLCRDVMKRLRDDYKRKSGNQTLVGTDDSPITDDIPPQIGQLDTAPLPSTNFDASDFQIDPTLLGSTTFTLSITSKPTAAYIRPHPASQVHASDKMWLASLSSRNFSELYSLVSNKWRDASISRIHGVEKGGDGQEISYLIEEDDELDAYLDHVQNKKAVFVVLLNRH